ncbi:hypothetical protein Fcan01_26571 [Folsomia candida]|uniref:Uncharacterized protein n=1 Tax=Folsomia candida TaxID=158441 RepID=A0A226D1J6_FOLCA|nr:hypothetical protein Fcan01_26571 [Folsomia candida]
MDIKDINLIKHNLACGSKYRCLRVKWDTSQDQIAVSGSRTQTMVRLSLLLNAVAVMARIFIIFTHPLNLIEQAEASIAMASYAMGFLIRLDIPIDHVAVHLVNFLIRQPVQKFGPEVSKLQLGVRFFYLSAEWTSYLISGVVAAHILQPVSTHPAKEESFTTCPSQILMSFGYVVGSYECTKTLKWFDSMATFAPATPTQRDENHKSYQLQKSTKNPILLGF